ncbi:hypothetical protein TNCV_607491 [Trichonephila clavipes]|nr:hypothetical protein TNCV_607491 [Trichonephila clavipes]
MHISAGILRVTPCTKSALEALISGFIPARKPRTPGKALSLSVRLFVKCVVTLPGSSMEYRCDSVRSGMAASMQPKPSSLARRRNELKLKRNFELVKAEQKTFGH